MPMLQVNRCPICGKLSDNYDSGGPQPDDWLSLSIINTRTETLCSWECLETYAHNKGTGAGV